MPEIRAVQKVFADAVAPALKAAHKYKICDPGSPIGIFDSGVGGLTVLAEVVRALPLENVIYLADTARVPYGSRPPEEIIKINQQILNFFLKQEVKMVIIACGTSSSIAYPKLKELYKIPLVEMIEPGSRAALAATKNKKIGVIATQNTVDSGAYQDRLIEMNRQVEVIAAACPLFVPLIEGGFINAVETKKVAEEYLKPLVKQRVDTLILGCTHYPHLSKLLSGLINAALVNPAVEAVRSAREILAKNNQLKNCGGFGRYSYYTSSNPQQFEVLGSKLFGRMISQVKEVTLDGL